MTDPAEQLLASFPEDSEQARTIRHLIGYRTEYEALRRELATPPAGWFPFGHHVTDTTKPELEFWGDEAGLPIWERPVEPAISPALLRALFDGRALEVAPEDDMPFIRVVRTALGMLDRPWHAARPGEEWFVEYDPAIREISGFLNRSGPHIVYEANGGQLYFRRLEDDGAQVHLRIDNTLIRRARRTR